jgi:hypothetical protein
MQRVFVVAYNHGMAGVRPASVTDDYIALFGEYIDDLALSLITPLQPCYAPVHLTSISLLTYF